MFLSVNFAFFHKLIEKDNFLSVYEEFKYYKSHSISNSNFSSKMQTRTITSLQLLNSKFRSSENSFEAKLISGKPTTFHSVKKEHLWFDEDGYPLLQWNIKSNISIIYSYFTHKSIRYFYVVEYINNYSNVNFHNKHIKTTWNKITKNYRVSITA